MMWDEVKAFLKALVKHWGTLLTGGTIMAIVAGTDLSGTPIPASFKWWIVPVTLLTAGFQTWQKEYRERLRLQENLASYPRLRIAKVEEGTMWSSYKGGIFTNEGPKNSVIWLRLKNEPLNNTAESVAEQVRASVKFYGPDGNKVCEMEGRWSHTTQPPQRDPTEDTMKFLAVTFPVGATLTLDIAFKNKARGECFGFNDNSYNYDDYENPALRLPAGTIVVNVVISGVSVNCHVFLQFHNPVGAGELKVLKYGYR
jgi:hypothetical protein